VVLYTELLCYHPYLVSMLFADLLGDSRGWLQPSLGAHSPSHWIVGKSNANMWPSQQKSTTSHSQGKLYYRHIQQAVFLPITLMSSFYNRTQIWSYSSTRTASASNHFEKNAEIGSNSIFVYYYVS